MAQTKINPMDQVPAASLTRAMMNTAVAGKAVITKIIAGDNLSLVFTGADSGTGDVTLTACENASGCVQVGSGAIPNSTATSNTGIGINALSAVTTAIRNTAVGYEALQNSTGASNTAVGGLSSTTLTTGASNTAVGSASLNACSTGNNNTAIGTNALLLATSSQNTAIGASALTALTSGAQCTAVGASALATLSTNQGCVAVGNSALQLATGSTNTMVGSSAGAAITTGSGNTGIGRQVLNTTTGSNNNAFGNGSGSGVTTGSGNTIIGQYTGAAAPISATGSNFVVLSDGLANIKLYFDGSGNASYPAGTFNILSGATLDANSGATLSIAGIPLVAPFTGNFFAGDMTTFTAIGDVTTLASGGQTLTNQIMEAGSVWRIKAFGSVTSANSATARNASLHCYWGSVDIGGFDIAVKVSTAITTAFDCEFYIVGQSTTLASRTARLFDNIVAGTATSTLINQLLNANSPTLTAGAQTIDLRFGFSAAIAGDGWTVENVTIERLN